jgi:adenylylsulfate kinase
MRVLVYGISGAGKTSYTKEINEILHYDVITGEELRRELNDWDFSYEGLIRQTNRIKKLVDARKNVIIDMMAPLQEMRDILKPDYLIWMDAIQQSIYPEIDAIFEKPEIDESPTTMRIHRYGGRAHMAARRIKDLENELK